MQFFSFKKLFNYYIFILKNSFLFILLIITDLIMTSITLLGTLTAKYNKRLVFEYTRHLRNIYTLSKVTSPQSVTLTTSPQKKSILWSNKEEPPKGFEGFFPGAKKSNKTEKSADKKSNPNPFDFKKFSSSGGGGSGSEDDK